MILPNDKLIKVLASLPNNPKIMVIGEPDTGKSTVIKFIGNWFLEKGNRVALVDSDVGQSDIGPPGFVSCKFMGQDIGDKASLGKFSYLVGKTSPYGKELSIVTGTRACVEAAKNQANVVLIDTCGLVSPPKGVQLKCAKAEAIKPDLILSLHTHSISPLANSLELLGFNVYNFTPLDKARDKSYDERKDNRVTCWNTYIGDNSSRINIWHSRAKVRRWWEESTYVRIEDIPHGTVAAVPNPLMPGFHIPCIWLVSDNIPSVLAPFPKDFQLDTVWVSTYKLQLDGNRVIWA